MIPHLADQFCYWNSDFSLLQHSNDLLLRKLLPHGKILRPLQGKFFAKTSLQSDPVFARAITHSR